MNSRIAKVGGLAALVFALVFWTPEVTNLGTSDKNVYGTSCEGTQNLMSQQDAESFALSRAAFAEFKYNGGAPTIIDSRLNTIDALSTIFDVYFNDALSTTTCVWYIVMQGAVNVDRISMRPGPTSTPGGSPNQYNVMEVGMDAATGDLLTENFIGAIGGATPTYGPTATGTQPTPYAISTPQTTPPPTPTP